MTTSPPETPGPRPPTPDPSTSTPGPVGRPPILDNEKRQKILALLTLGSSRRMAARYICCAPSTIARTILRDPEFADQVARAEQNVEIEALPNVRRAARNERYWRANVWLLEHHNRLDYNPAEKARTMPLEAAIRLAVNVLYHSIEDLPDEIVDRIVARINETLHALQEQQCDGTQTLSAVFVGLSEQPLPPRVPSFTTAPAADHPDTFEPLDDVDDMTEANDAHQAHGDQRPAPVDRSFAPTTTPELKAPPSQPSP